MKFLFCTIAVLFLCACAPSLYNTSFEALDYKASETADSANSKIHFAVKNNGDSIQMPKKLQSAYFAGLSDAIPEGCVLNLSFDGKVEERYLNPWYLGVFVLAVFWPAMPREDDIQVSLQSDLVCDSVSVESATLFEEEHPRLFWYGAYRNWYVQERTDMIHTKLISRIKQSILHNVPADATIQSDIF